jgi:hypothetical protein
MAQNEVLAISFSGGRAHPGAKKRDGRGAHGRWGRPFGVAGDLGRLNSRVKRR